MLQVANGETQADNKRNGQETSMRREQEPLTEPKRHAYGNQALLRMGRAGAMPPQPPLRPSQTVFLQRKCACGSPAMSGGECEECKAKKRLLLQTKLTIGESGDVYEQEADRVADQVMAAPTHSAVSAAPARIQRHAGQTTGQADIAPASVDQALASPGSPLEPALREDMEQRFGHDFSGVRVHSGGAAEQSARDVNAYAYTVGHDIVFGADRSASGTQEGLRLLAHELTHVVQQEKNQPLIQRACGAKQISGIKGCIGLGSDLQDYGVKSDDIYKFKISCDEFLPGEEDRFRGIAANINQNQIIDVHGFASEEGLDQFNEDLSCARAHKAAGILYEAGLSASQLRHVFMHGAKKGLREELRSVVLDFVGLTESALPSEKPKFLCGPDVTDEIESTVAHLRSSFDGLSSDQQEEVCGTLNSLLAGSYTWDIIELHNNSWINKYYRPKCATEGANPPCGESIQVGNQCYWAGSANYVIFGVMCRLCQQNLDEDDASDYDEDHMLELIDFYKGPGMKLPKIWDWDASGNWESSRRWAQAGYHGWPSGGTPPKGDLNNCAPQCPTRFFAPHFNVRWCPHFDPGNQCTFRDRRRRSDRRVLP